MLLSFKVSLANNARILKHDNQEAILCRLPAFLKIKDGRVSGVGHVRFVSVGSVNETAFIFLIVYLTSLSTYSITAVFVAKMNQLRAPLVMFRICVHGTATRIPRTHRQAAEPHPRPLARVRLAPHRRS